VSSWIKALRDDKNELFRAAYDASRASEFLLALERDKSFAQSLVASINATPETRRRRWSRKPLESSRISKPSRI
jgi:antirestriction protein ArdC